MMKLELGEQSYYLPYVTARALREIGPMDALYERASANEDMTQADMDTAIDWLCLLFNHQFNPDQVLDGYPLYAFWMDVFTMYLAVRKQVEVELVHFPTPPEAIQTLTNQQTKG